MISRDETQQQSGWNDLDLWLMNGSDSLKKFGRGLARILHGEVDAQFDYWHLGSRLSKRAWCVSSPVHLHGWPENKKFGRGGPQQDEGVVDVICGERVISGTPQNFAKVSEDVSGRVDTENPDVRSRDCTQSLFAVKGGDCIRFCGVHLEERKQVGQSQNLADHFRDVAQLHVPVTGSQASEEANDGTQATAVNESDVAEVQDNLFKVAIETLNTIAEAIHFRSAYDSTAAANYNNVTH